MAKGAGIGSKLALNKASVWGQPTSVNKTNSAIDYLSEDFGLGIPEYIDDEGVARSWPADPLRGNVVANGSFRAYLRYLGLEYVLASPLGVAAVSAVATGVRRHRYTYTSDVYGVFATVAIDRGVSIHEYPSSKFSGFTISGQAGRPVEGQFRALCNNSTNPATKNTTLASASFRSSGHHVQWSNLTLLVATKAGAAPTSTSDQYEPSAFEFTYDRPLSQHYVMNGSAEMIEPIIDGAPNATMRLTFPRYATAPAGTPGNYFIAAAKANTALKLWLRGVGPTITGAHRHRFDLYAGNVFVQSVTSNIANANAIPMEVVLSLKSTPSVPTGLPAWLGAGGVAIGLTTSVATSPLAG